ncbi:thioesterase family protein [Oricola sp.]|uniref:thioesterase family protein n=1 Tax=Oricola sp. TaxID=1979950 RepID=UPI0025FC445E|nr:thioesterase family protein [Oricola sp.]MCI5077830.1 thioesterase family protein [Oricola sp.]
MNLLFRLIQVLLTLKRRGPMSALDESRLTLRCWPNDLDTNLHMNNGRYLTVMDLGRFDLIMRTGLWPIMRERKWYPVVGSAKITFRRSLNAFDRFDLTTRILGWDEKWLYMEHRMERDGKLMAHGLIKGLFLGPDGKVPMDQLVAAVGYHDASPELASEVISALA